MNPAAYWSPAPVVSTTFSTGSAATTKVSPPAAITEPWAPRVTAAIFTLPRRAVSAVSKSSVWNSPMISASFPNTRSIWVSRKASSASRWRSTTKLSERVRAIIRPAPRARAAAFSKPRRAAGASNR